MRKCICCSIEFDRDNELFATAGVSRRIKVFEFSSVSIGHYTQVQYRVCTEMDLEETFSMTTSAVSVAF